MHYAVHFTPQTSTVYRLPSVRPFHQPGEPFLGFIASIVPSRSAAEALPARTTAQRNNAPLANAATLAVALNVFLCFGATRLATSRIVATISPAIAPFRRRLGWPLKRGLAASPVVAEYPAIRAAYINPAGYCEVT